MSPTGGSAGPLGGKLVVLGVSGGIAAYKAIELARLLTLDGAGVQTVLTRNARRFVRSMPFQVLTGRAPISKMFPIEVWPISTTLSFVTVICGSVGTPKPSDVLR